MKSLKVRFFIAVVALFGVLACSASVEMRGSFIENKNWSAVSYYLDNGGDINWKNEEGVSLLYLLLYEGNNDLSLRLVQQRADLDPPISDTFATALFIASGEGLPDVVEAILRRVKGTYALKDQKPVDSFVYAASEGRLEVVKKFIEFDLDLDATNLPKTALYYSLQAGHSDVAEYLIAVGADINFVANDGSSLLIPAAYGGSIEVIKYLVAHGFDVMQSNKNNLTPLTAAVAGKQVDVARYLLKLGANPCVKTIEGYSAYSLAVKSDIVKFKDLFSQYHCETLDEDES